MKLLKFWPILCIALVAFFLRVVNIESLFYFTYDESVPAFVGRRLMLLHHLPLIGGVTPFGFHLAPYFYWMLSAILIIGELNPISWGYAGALLSVLTVFLIYVIGREFSSKRVGIIASVFWATSYLAGIYDRHFWALWWGPLVSLITLFSLYKIVKGNFKYVWLLAPTLAFALCADPSNFVFVFLTFVVWFIYKLPKKLLGIIIIVILASLLPLLAFDLRHDFANIKPVFKFLQAGQNKPGIPTEKLAENTLLFPRTFSRLVYTTGDREISKQYSYCVTYAKGKLENVPWYFTLSATVGLLYFAYWTIKKSNHVGWKLLALLVASYFFGIQVYGTIFKADIFEHYITGLFAAFLLIAAKGVSVLPTRVQLFILILFVALNVHKTLITENKLGLTNKRQAIEYTMQQVGDKPFSLDSLSTCWKLNGYRYLFTVFGREPIKSYVDPNFEYLYAGTPVADVHPETVVAFVAHDFEPETEEFYARYKLLKSHQIASETFGALEVIIMDNSTNWFEQTSEQKKSSVHN